MCVLCVVCVCVCALDVRDGGVASIIQEREPAAANFN
jgi:hypothetical protein